MDKLSEKQISDLKLLALSGKHGVGEDYKETTFAILLYNNFTFVTLIRD